MYILNEQVTQRIENLKEITALKESALKNAPGGTLPTRKMIYFPESD